ncbi:MAG: hypothetical protein M0P74_00630 [Syntrophales bacterium]|nr:hypothetical protein [Syntrophales bacterium]
MTTLKDCLYSTIHRNRKPLKLIAEEIGMSENYLLRAALPDTEESDTGTGCRFPLKKLVPLIRETDDFSVLDHIEQSLGRIAIKAPLAAATNSGLPRLTMQAVKEFGELCGDLDASIADGTLTDNEIAHIKAEGYEACQAIMTLLHNIGIGKLK